MLPRCNVTALLSSSSSSSASSSSSSSPSPRPPHTSIPNSSSNNPFFLAALSFLFFFRNLSSASFTPSIPRPPATSFSPKKAARMRGAAAVTAARSPSPGPRRRMTTVAPAFSSPDSLSDWLRRRLPSDSFASWGVKPGTKTVHNLWLELSLGETSLLLSNHEDGGAEESSPEPPKPPPPPETSLLRTVHVATVKIRNPSGAMLVETHQLLSDGTIRQRRRPLSEKMKPGESVEEAAARAVREELGGEATIRVVPGSYETRVEEKVSASYPGLPAQYVLHSVEAELEGVQQEGEFSTEESGECCEASSEVSQKAVFVRRHFWKWVHHDGDDDGAGESIRPPG